jgi:transposase
MNMALFWLDDEQWAAIEPFMPKNQPGAHRQDDRRIISGIFHVLKTGCRWQDCPAEYGPHTTVYNRFNRWSRKRFWTGMFEALTKASAATNNVAIDATYIKAQRSAFGGKGGPKRRRSAPRAAETPRKFMPSPM